MSAVIHPRSTVVTTLRPHEKGTMAETEKYGEQLVKVRYRWHDGRYIKTVELIEKDVEERYYGVAL